MKKRANGRARPYLLASAAVFGIALGGTAQAADSPTITGRLNAAEVEDAPHAVTSSLDPSQAENVPHALSVAPPETYVGRVNVTDERQVVISEPGTPTTARDPANVNGIGQMIVSTPAAGGGVSLGLCTGTLINPRTVIFAAHCVNTRAATAYGSGSGGVAIGFGFNNANNTTQPGQPAGTSPLLNWLFGQGTRAANTTSVAENFYTVNGVVYNPLSLEPAAQGFLYGDVAIASLDTPAANIPTWALLFSPLNAPAQITAGSGTGYHVAISGYGANGVGSTGATGAIDYRRRIAENWLGALTSFNVRDSILFGPGTTTNRPQNLYWLDLDDPRRGTAAASPFDFNIFRDNPLPNEGITAGGDSGGPLILDRTFTRQIVIGVLSGGSRFFGAQPFSTYGTASFYQPLYLYWDWIAQNNPYRYVGAVAGNGNWEDPTRWTTLQDPNYFIIGPNGQLVNGVPNDPGQQSQGSAGQFGQICVQGPAAGGGAQGCQDLVTGNFIPTPGGIGTSGDATLGGGDAVTNNLGSAVINGGAADANNVGSATISGPAVATIAGGGGSAGTAAGTTGALPPATITNGLPGATNFVPNNTAGNRVNGVLPRYFDVTLAANGTTTLSSAVTIDRLTLNGIGAGLTLSATGNLTSLINVSQFLGTMQVNGRLTSAGDFLLAAGGLSGNGVITAPFTTSIAAVISPGADPNPGTFGTLTFRGNLVLASGTTTLIDLGPSGVSDRIAVQATQFTTATPPVAIDGRLDPGGALVLRFNNATMRAGNTYTIATAEGGFTANRFATPGPFSAILNPVLTYTTNALNVRVNAGFYISVVDLNSQTQRSFANLLDQNRNADGSGLAGIHQPLDLQNAAVIRNVFEGLAPRTEAALYSLGFAASDNLARFYRDRLATHDFGVTNGGTVTMIGRPVELAALSAGGIAANGLPTSSDAAPPAVVKAKLPDTLAVYLAGGYIQGSSRAMTGAVPFGGRDPFNGFYIAAGAELDVAPKAMLGVSFSYSELNSQVNGFPQRAGFGLYHLSAYGKVELTNNIFLDGQFGGGTLQTNTYRTVNFLGPNFTLFSQSTGFTLDGEGGVSKKLTFGQFNLTPRGAIRFAHLNYGNATESGGGPRLQFQRANLLTIQGRAGFIAELNKGPLRPFLTAYYVRELGDRGDGVVLANFRDGVGAFQPFALNGRDRNWGEVSGGLSYNTPRWTVSANADTTFGRDDIRNWSLRGSLAYRF